MTGIYLDISLQNETLKYKLKDDTGDIHGISFKHTLILNTTYTSKTQLFVYKMFQISNITISGQLLSSEFYNFSTVQFLKHGTRRLEMQIIQITETNVDTPCGNPAVYEHKLRWSEPRPLNALSVTQKTSGMKCLVYDKLHVSCLTRCVQHVLKSTGTQANLERKHDEHDVNSIQMWVVWYYQV